jgi:mono/diheme cytochrome c family protein
MRAEVTVHRILLALVILFASTLSLEAQGRGPTRAPQGARGATGRGGISAEEYPSRPLVDPAIMARGKELYDLHCAFCHAEDARGSAAPNLLRSEIVLLDQSGEKIFKVVQNPRGAMPIIDLSAAQVSDIAAYIHAFRVWGRDASRDRPASILVGDAKAGERAFESKCASCHSATGDLKSFGARSSDPIALQQAWLMPSGGRGGPNAITDVPPKTATVTPPMGQKFEGRLMRIDDFSVSLQLADESTRTFRRQGDTPNVEVHDPMTAHRALLRTYTDKEIHDLTAYLVTLR